MSTHSLGELEIFKFMEAKGFEFFLQYALDKYPFGNIQMFNRPGQIITFCIGINCPRKTLIRLDPNVSSIMFSGPTHTVAYQDLLEHSILPPINTEI